MKPAVVESRPRQLHAPDRAPQVLQLSNGQYSVRLSDVGSGSSELGGIAVTRWVPDETQDAHGFFIYLRDLDDYTTWSAGLQPTRTVPHSYEFRPGAERAEIVRTDHQITQPTDDMCRPAA